MRRSRSTPEYSCWQFSRILRIRLQSATGMGCKYLVSLESRRLFLASTMISCIRSSSSNSSCEMSGLRIRINGTPLNVEIAPMRTAQSVVESDSQRISSEFVKKSPCFFVFVIEFTFSPGATGSARVLIISPCTFDALHDHFMTNIPSDRLHQNHTGTDRVRGPSAVTPPTTVPATTASPSVHRAFPAVFSRG
jgi:hypothetical protein